MQGPYKNMLDVLDKTAALIKKLSLWKEDTEKVSGSSQYFIFLASLLEKKSMMLPSNLRSVFLHHLAKLEWKFTKHFPKNLSSYELIHNPFYQPTPSPFTKQEKEDYIDLTCDNFRKRKFNSGNPTNFWILLNVEYSALTEKALQMVILFATSYSCEAGFSIMAIIKAEYRSRIYVKRDTRVAVSKILPRYEDHCKNKQAH